MLTLVTGVPGAGKTSNTLWEFVNHTTPRPRFVTPIVGFDPIEHGIGELESLEHWPDLPDGALVLVDEAQQFLRPRSSRQVPEWLAAFETHRHRGMDFYLITQHPGLIDSHVRKLVGKHIHYHRPWGLKTATRYTWEIVQENPHLPSAHKSGEAVRLKPNPKVFSLYKSTVIDTHKASLPWKWINTGFVGLAILFAGASYFFHYVHQHSVNPQAVVGVPVTATKPAFRAASESAVPMTAQTMMPRVKGMPWTAPVYDNLTKPSDFPRLAACMASKRTGCSCYTQQATPINIDPGTCYLMVKQGTFDPWISGRHQLEQGKLSEHPRDADPRASIPAPGDAVEEPVGQSGWSQSPSYTSDLGKMTGL